MKKKTMLFILIYLLVGKLLTIGFENDEGLAYKFIDYGDKAVFLTANYLNIDFFKNVSNDYKENHEISIRHKSMGKQDKKIFVTIVWPALFMMYVVIIAILFLVFLLKWFWFLLVNVWDLFLIILNFFEKCMVFVLG